MEYPKINSLWKREGWYFDEKTKEKTPHELQGKRQSFIVGDYACTQFGNIKKWSVEEKVDGTNIRVNFSKGSDGVKRPGVVFRGRTKDSQMPTFLLEKLQDHFTEERFCEVFPEPVDMVLYGEGYGPKIQACGGNYRHDNGFILFDVWINGWWLERDGVTEIASKLKIDCCPKLGVMTEEEIVQFVKSKPLSHCSKIPQMMEGVICRPDPLLLFRDGKPLMFKLKCKDFYEQPV